MHRVVVLNQSGQLSIVDALLRSAQAFYLLANCIETSSQRTA